jgi:hypothetical protein
LQQARSDARTLDTAAGYRNAVTGRFVDQPAAFDVSL